MPSGTGSVPVVSASRLTAPTMFSEGKFSTHSPVRTTFEVVFDTALNPIMQRNPSQKMEDIGARLAEPFSLSVLIRTTGVPK